MDEPRVDTASEAITKKSRGNDGKRKVVEMT